MTTLFRASLLLLAISGSNIIATPRLLADSYEDAREDARRQERRRQEQRQDRMREECRRDEEQRRMRCEEESRQQRRLHPELQIASPHIPYDQEESR